MCEGERSSSVCRHVLGGEEVGVGDTVTPVLCANWLSVGWCAGCMPGGEGFGGLLRARGMC